jgi:hypothetical protein
LLGREDYLMSHHLDTPLAAQNGQLFIDDLYVSPARTERCSSWTFNSDVTGGYAKPGFQPEARYKFKVHFDGADFGNLAYRISFGEPDPAGQQPRGYMR